MNTEDINFLNARVLPQIIKGYVNRNFFNVGEFRLFFELMTDEAFAVTEDICSRGKPSIDQMMVFVRCRHCEKK